MAQSEYSGEERRGVQNQSHGQAPVTLTAPSPLRAIRTEPAETSSLLPPPSRLRTGPETTAYCVFSMQSFLAWPCWTPEGRAGGVTTSKVALRSISSLKAGRRSFSMSTGAGLPGTDGLVTRGHGGSPGQQPLGQWSKTFKATFPKENEGPRQTHHRCGMEAVNVSPMNSWHLASLR